MKFPHLLATGLVSASLLAFFCPSAGVPLLCMLVIWTSLFFLFGGKVR